MRILPRPLEARPLYLRAFFWNQRRNFGTALNAALVWVRAPKLFLGVAHLAVLIFHPWLRTVLAGPDGRRPLFHRQPTF